MMKNEALIIFVRRPRLGKVKTRLAASVGEEAALKIYEKLLEHTHAVSAVVACDKYVFYANEVEKEDIWDNRYTKLLQENADLGGRIKAAFVHLFREGYQRICIIGSDCFELTEAVISQAFLVLQSYDVVIGPAMDGGYYLLGMKDGLKEIFDEIEWSTEYVLQQTKNKIEMHGYSYFLLPMLNDVDTVDDVPDEVLSDLRLAR